MSEILEVTQQERVLRIALNRPEKHNALSSESVPRAGGRHQSRQSRSAHRRHRPHRQRRVLLRRHGSQGTRHRFPPRPSTTSTSSCSRSPCASSTPLIGAVNGWPRRRNGPRGQLPHRHRLRKGQIRPDRDQAGPVALPRIPRHAGGHRRAPRRRVGPDRPHVRRQGSAGHWLGPRDLEDANRRAMELGQRIPNSAPARYAAASISSRKYGARIGKPPGSSLAASATSCSKAPIFRKGFALSGKSGRRSGHPLDNF